MNKQEVIDEIENAIPDFLLNDFQRGKETGLSYALELVNQLAEPEKPVVPQFVAEWIEYCKTTKLTFLGAFYPVSEHGIRFADTLTDEIWKAIDWSKRNQETFARAWLDGYEIEKEKLYTVEIPNHNDINLKHTILAKNSEGEVFLTKVDSEDWKYNYHCQLTESEIKQDFEWAFQFAKEVEE